MDGCPWSPQELLLEAGRWGFAAGRLGQLETGEEKSVVTGSRLYRKFLKAVET